MNKFFHSVYLMEDLCKGCTNCIKRCPTEAIRVRGGKARITSEFCIDCGECVRICPHHAKKIRRDRLDILDKYEYTIALPAPSLYSQFNNLDDVNIVLTALIYLGFDDVFEVSAAAEIVSAASRIYVEDHPQQWPIISTACPSVVRLIRVRFPNLIEHLLPILPPVEVAARVALERVMAKTGLSRDKIGIIFISPCPSKVTFSKSPLGIDYSEIDGVIGIKDIYPEMISMMKEAEQAPRDLAISGKIGIGWGGSGGEAGGLITDSYLAADGIENVIHVLEDMEDEKFTSLKFIELNACNGGCVGGVLTVENPYVAKAKLKRLNKYLPVSVTHLETDKSSKLYWNSAVKYEPVYNLGCNIMDSINKLKQVDELTQKFPGLDCGSCGAPSCKALAEDIVRGDASIHDCIHILKDHIHNLSLEYSELAKETAETDASSTDCIYMLQSYIDRITKEINLLDENTMDGGKKENDD